MDDGLGENPCHGAATVVVVVVDGQMSAYWNVLLFEGTTNYVFFFLFQEKICTTMNT